MGFGWDDLWNPISQTQSTWNFVSGPFGNSQQIQNDPAPPYDGPPTTGPNGTGNLAQSGLPVPDSYDDHFRQMLLGQQGAQAGKFADSAERGYTGYGDQAQSTLDYMKGQMQGRNSVSAAQLQQGLQSLYAQQAAQAASASPRNSPMAARTAMMNSGRMGAGMAGQQAVAGLQERNQAANQYGNMLAQMRGQDLNAALQSRSNAQVGYGAQATGAPAPSWIQQYGPAIVGATGAVASAFSDRSLKTKIKPGDVAANSAIEALTPYTYAYRDPRHGVGRHVGVMAQDLEKAGLRQAVIDTPAGKHINAGKLAGANTAMIAALGQRVAALEGDKPGGLAGALLKRAGGAR